MVLASTLGDDDSLLSDDVLIELGFTQLRDAEPPAPGGDDGSVPQKALMPEPLATGFGTLIGIPNYLKPDFHVCSSFWDFI